MWKVPLRLWRREPQGGNSDASRLVQAGDEARNRKDWQTAARNYAAAVAVDPNLSHIAIQYAHALKESGDYEQASNAYYAALEQMPNDDDLHLHIGHLEKLRNNLHQALFYYERAAELNPANQNARSEFQALKYKISQSEVRVSPSSISLNRPEVRRFTDEEGDGLPILGINITGGLGDYIVIARYIRDLQAATEPFRFDIFCNYPKTAHWVFSKILGYRTCYSEFLFKALANHYTLALRINQYVMAHEEAADWYSLRKVPRLVDVMQRIVRFRPEIEIFIDHHPSMDGFLAQKAVYMNCNRANFLHQISGIPYGGDRFNLDVDGELSPRKFNLEDQAYITVHNGFDPGVVINATTATKCYPRYGEVIDRLRKEVPELVVIQLGTSNSQPIKGVSIDLIGRTTLAEAAAILSKSRLHLDNESGLVHLGTALGVKCCVVFGPTPLEYFGYEENINLGPKFCGGCWWINDTWMEQCPRGFVEARCMTAHEPASIAAAVLRAIDGDWLPDKHGPGGRVVATEAPRIV
jgi:tetratricopeptide (TPR) repeat protein